MATTPDPCSRAATVSMAQQRVQDTLLQSQLALASTIHDVKWSTESKLNSLSDQLQQMQQSVADPIQDALASYGNQLKAAQQSVYSPALNELGDIAYRLDQLERQFADILPRDDKGDIDYGQIAKDHPPQFPVQDASNNQAIQGNAVPSNPVQATSMQQPGFNPSTVSPDAPSVPGTGNNPGPCPPPIVNVNCPPPGAPSAGVSAPTQYPPAEPECNLWNPLAWLNDKCAKEFLDSVSNTFGDLAKPVLLANGIDAQNNEFDALMSRLRGK